jgi:hypothetical protein
VRPAIRTTATPKTLILHWNGASWKRVPSPSIAGGTVLSGVAAASGAVWAAGTAVLGTPYQTLVLSWNGNLAPLRDLGWARQARHLTYWGDLDTEGFTILSAFRALGYPARSVLMDEATLIRYRRLAIEDTATPNRGVLGHLTQREYDTWQGLLSDRWGHRLRLEQERIPLSAGAQALQNAEKL